VAPRPSLQEPALRNHDNPVASRFARLARERIGVRSGAGFDARSDDAGFPGFASCLSALDFVLSEPSKLAIVGPDALPTLRLVRFTCRLNLPIGSS